MSVNDASTTLIAPRPKGLLDPATGSRWATDQIVALETVAASGDPRLAWIIAELMRFAGGSSINGQLSGAAATLLGIENPVINQWGVITDH